MDHLLFSFPAEEQPTSSELSSSSAQLLHSGIQHVSLASFVFGSTDPLPIPAAFFRWPQSPTFSWAGMNGTRS
jgi:hypothetical protein